MRAVKVSISNPSFEVHVQLDADEAAELGRAISTMGYYVSRLPVMIRFGAAIQEALASA